MPVARLASTWGQGQNRLSEPMAALPLGDGITALVLDGVGNTSRLLEVDLATGTVVRTITAGLAGLPTALALDVNEKRALVATDLGLAWQLFGVDLGSGTPTALIAAGATGPVGPVRGVLPIGANAALATVGNSLWRLDWSGTGTIVRTRDNLASPWGLAFDPLRPGHVLIAERGADRIVSFEVNTRAIEPVPARRTGGPAFVQPTAIATAGTGAGTRLIALCNAATPAQREILGLNLGTRDDTVFSLGLVPDNATTVATGVAGLLLVALPESTDLAAGGGIEQKREVVSFDPATATATVAQAFAPAVRESQAWRTTVTRSFSERVRATSVGKRGIFVWDSRQAGLRPDGALIKATSMDAEFGRSTQTFIAHAIENVDSTGIPTISPVSVAAADLDGDGDLDLVCANADSERTTGSLTVFFQDPPRAFTTQEVLPLAAGSLPMSVAAADLDGDGDLDVVSANTGSNNLTVFFGRSR